MHAKRKLENGSIFADCENRLPIKPLIFAEMMFSRGVPPPPPPPPPPIATALPGVSEIMLVRPFYFWYIMLYSFKHGYKITYVMT
jgi:hypothetical protein